MFIWVFFSFLFHSWGLHILFSPSLSPPPPSTHTLCHYNQINYPDKWSYEYLDLPASSQVWLTLPPPLQSWSILLFFFFSSSLLFLLSELEKKAIEKKKKMCSAFFLSSFCNSSHHDSSLVMSHHPHCSCFQVLSILGMYFFYVCVSSQHFSFPRETCVMDRAVREECHRMGNL